jgi:hypothetical protein
MPLPENWQATFNAEIQQAEQARAAGNEGMARVCARRAAGALVGEYFKRQGIEVDTPSAYDRLRYLSELPGVSPQTSQTAALLLTRLTPEHTLPVDADLIAEARFLRQELLGE